MKIISPRTHGILDYLLVVFLLISPTVFVFPTTMGYVAYALAGTHLLLTIFTAFPLGLIRVIPFALHALLEFVVALAAIISPYIFGFWEDAQLKWYWMGFGLALFVIWFTTAYTKPGHQHATE